ncbi:hypothetical protein ACJX0J_040072, partial [Zea mays]
MWGTLVNSLPLLEQENLKRYCQQNDGEQTQTLQQGKIVEVEENSRSSIEHRRVTNLQTTAFAIIQRRAIAVFIARKGAIMIQQNIKSQECFTDDSMNRICYKFTVKLLTNHNSMIQQNIKSQECFTDDSMNRICYKLFNRITNHLTNREDIHRKKVQHNPFEHWIVLIAIIAIFLEMIANMRNYYETRLEASLGISRDISLSGTFLILYLMFLGMMDSIIGVLGIVNQGQGNPSRAGGLVANM